MKKIYRLAEIGKLNKFEFTLYFISFLVVPISLLLSNNIFKFITLTLLTLVLLFLVILYKREEEERDFPRYYSISLYLLLISSSLIIFLTYLGNETIVIYGFVIVFFVYLFVVGIIVYLLFNFIFIFGLKKMFPYERVVTNRVNRLSLKKLSKYIDLDKQKLYFNMNLINLIVYLVFVFFVMLLLIKFQNTETSTKMGEFSVWINKQDSISLFNGVSLFSLMIAIYTITFPAQRKIIDDAEQRYNEKLMKFK